MRRLRVGKTKWVSLVNPMPETIARLGKDFPKIHPLVLEEITTPTIRARVENYDHHLYVVLRFPFLDEKTNRVIAQEIDFIVIKDALITVQYDEIPDIERIWRDCEKGMETHAHHHKTPIHLLYDILQRLFARSLGELDKLQTQIESIEEEIFAGREKEIFEDISILKRNVFDFRRAIKPHHLTLESLVVYGVKLYGEEVRPFLMDLIGDYNKTWDLIENHKETLDALYETNSALLASKTNESVRVFTIIAFISFIPAAIANIYGMNIALPFSDQKNAFWIVTGLMIGLTVVVWAILKWRKLL